VISGQTVDIAPADRRMYALRDVTATVESLPLIVSSILSKKLAAGLDALVLDVKFGCGAFMTSETDAIALAQHLVETSEALGLPAIAFLTDMEAPLGRAVGNAVEVASALECLNGQGPEDVMELVFTLGTAMLCLADGEGSWESQRARLENALRTGAGLTRFTTMIREQGGDASIVDDPKRLPQAGGRSDVLAPEDGYVAALDARAIGRVVLELGGGRKKAEDPVDLAVGVLIHRRPGERVRRGERLATVLGRTPQEATHAVPNVLRSYAFTDAAPAQRSLVRYLVSTNDLQPWDGARTWSALDLSNLLRIS
ncbi:MAG TPA: thymidine phosphorylase, partial [Candidatus Eisenbacteria bacterium]|nr:thymidine phosphorylase [Candidatus Eisenbacteria bacterium]